MVGKPVLPLTVNPQLVVEIDASCGGLGCVIAGRCLTVAVAAVVVVVLAAVAVEQLELVFGRLSTCCCHRWTVVAHRYGRWPLVATCCCQPLVGCRLKLSSLLPCDLVGHICGTLCDGTSSLTLPLPVVLPFSFLFLRFALSCCTALAHRHCTLFLFIVACAFSFGFLVTILFFVAFLSFSSGSLVAILSSVAFPLPLLSLFHLPSLFLMAPLSVGAAPPPRFVVTLLEVACCSLLKVVAAL